MDISRLIDVYVKIRDHRDELKKQYDAQREALDEKLQAIANALDAQMKELGTDSMKSESGTCFYATKDQASVEDFDSFVRQTVAEMWETVGEAPTQDDMVKALLDCGPLAFMNKSVAKGKVKEYIDEHNRPPAGIGYSTSIEVQVRRPRGKAKTKAA